MATNQKRHRVGRLVGVLGSLCLLPLIIWFILLGSGWTWMKTIIPSPAQTPAEQLMFKAALRLEDFPAGWTEITVRDEDLADAEGYRFIYTPPMMPPWVNASEQMYVYASPEAAQASVPNWLTKTFPTSNWREDPALAFAHHADEWRVACVPMVVNTTSLVSCGNVARYQQIIVVIYANIFTDRPGLSLADFRQLLEAMDRRLTEALSSTSK